MLADNGRLKHPTGEYADWTASPWVRELGLEHHFKLASTGAHITVDTPGLYLVYAQVGVGVGPAGPPPYRVYKRVWHR